MGASGGCQISTLIADCGNQDWQLGCQGAHPVELGRCGGADNEPDVPIDIPRPSSLDNHFIEGSRLPIDQNGQTLELGGADIRGTTEDQDAPIAVGKKRLERVTPEIRVDGRRVEAKLSNSARA